MPRASARTQLRHKVTLVSEAVTTNALMETLSGYDPDGGTELWADVRPLSASESYRAQRLGQDTSHMVTIRWRASGVATKDRILWRGRWLRVATVRDPDERKEWLEIMATDEGDAPPESEG